MRSISTSTRLAHTQRRSRGGLLGGTLIALGIASGTTFAVLSFHTSSPGPGGGGGGGGGGGTGTGAAATKGERKLQPGEMVVVLRLLGITPESLAASGFTANNADALFDTATTYCLQAERLTQLQLAHRDVNLASEKAVHPDAPGAVDGQGHQIALDTAQATLSSLESAGFTFVTTGADADKVAKLSSIRSNAAYGLPAPYLTVSRTGDQWLALRGALVARRYANAHNLQLDGAVAQVLSDAEADTTVAQALTDFAGGLGAVTTAWNTHEAQP